jgi:[ribosomal protein S5]-alanine N-acetyltransferase
MQEIRITTQRLSLRQLQFNDAEFIVDLVNQPSWLKYIGERNVHSIDDAIAYMQNGPMAMYQKHGMGLLLVERMEDKTPLGLCGLLMRDSLEHPDIGFAFHPSAWGQGYAKEAAQACVEHAFVTLRLERLLAITMSSNLSSIKLLRSIGLQYEKDIRFPPNDEVLQLFVKER